jgi:enamine deaminase RidA (YjgF/YER057c/UK114 family)
MKRYYFTYTSKKSSPQDQLNDCIQAYRTFTENLIRPMALRCTFFVDAENNQHYYDIKDLVHSNSKDVFFYPAVVGQAPYMSGMAVECVIIDMSELEASVHLRSVQGHPYIVLEHKGNKKLYASGIFGKTGATIKEQSISTFQLAEAILKEEGLEFSDIVRQWNYVEDITQTVDIEGTMFQHYQIFNDIRSLHYTKAQFKNGYPAATGIGMDTGGIILELIAGKGKSFEIVPIDNPDQISAHCYSDKVLVGKEIEEFEQRSTPKFERAKFVDSAFGRTLFISGTAAIRGENTIPSDDVKEQTNITIENIRQLEYNGSHDHSYSMFRLYVKDPAQGPDSYQISKNYFGDIPSLLLKGPVCRDNLVVEIEAEKAF